MKVYWKLYIVLLVSLGAARLMERVMVESGGFASRYLPFMFSLVIALGLYGCLRDKAILNRPIWVFVYYFSVVVTGMLLTFSTYHLISANNISVSGSLILLSIGVLLIPATMKLKHYASKNNEVWQSS